MSSSGWEAAEVVVAAVALVDADLRTAATAVAWSGAGMIRRFELVVGAVTAALGVEGSERERVATGGGAEEEMVVVVGKVEVVANVRAASSEAADPIDAATWPHVTRARQCGHVPTVGTRTLGVSWQR
jgi:hypothetical protein